VSKTRLDPTGQKRGDGATVVLAQGMPLEAALRTLKRQSGSTLRECRLRESYTKPSQRRRLKSRLARRRLERLAQRAGA
jgi:ribosomal protein S21